MTSWFMLRKVVCQFKDEMGERIRWTGVDAEDRHLRGGIMMLFLHTSI